METDIAIIAAGYALTRIGIIAAIAYLFYRVGGEFAVTPRPESEIARRSGVAKCNLRT